MAAAAKKDTEKKPVDKSTDKKEEKPEKKYNALTDLCRNVALLDKSVSENNKEKLPRVLRNTTRIRQSISKAQLLQAIEFYSPSNVEALKSFANTLPDSMNQVESSMDVEEEPTESITLDDKEKKSGAVPEVEVYLWLLVLSLLWMQPSLRESSLSCATTLLSRANEFNRRTLDPFVARAYSFLYLCHSSAGTLPSIRNTLLAAHRTACLRHDEIGQATLLNLLLGNYLSQHLYDQAFKLVSKTTFPEGVSNNQFVRYLFYVGKIQAVQLDYSDAYAKLMQAIRKVPQNTAFGFRRIVTKLSIIVQLLMGEVPERLVFKQKGLVEALAPYMELTNAVRIGDLVEFNAVMTNHSELFKKDNMYTLILRLRHNVIKTGLRKISLSYSRISFKDICEKLALETPLNAEFVCAKAIQDGVIDAVIDHKNGWMSSKEMVDVYGTIEPQQAFHKRTTFCLDVHNEAVKAMRYPPNAYKKELESAEERMEREKQDEELQKEIEDEMNEDGL